MSARETSRPNRHERLWLLLLALLAAGVRLYLASQPRVIRWDEPDYLWLGKSLLTGYGYTIGGAPELHYTPLFPLLAGGVYALTGNPELGSSFWYVLLGAATVVPVYALARRIYSLRVGLTAAGLAAIFPALSSAVLYWGTMTEPLFIFLVWCALWAAHRALEDERPWRFGLGGGLLCLAYLARPEGIVWAAAIGALVVVVWWVRRRKWSWRLAACFAVYVTVFLLLALPYAALLHRYTGKWMATGKLSITYDIGEAVLERDPVRYDEVTASLDPASGEILWWSAKRFERGVLDYLLDDPALFVQRMARNFQRMTAFIFAGMVFSRLLLAPVVLGWFRQPWTRRRLEDELLLWFGALPVLAFLPFHVEIRFFSPAFPTLLIWLAAGLWDGGRWIAETWAQWRRGDKKAEQATAHAATRRAQTLGALALVAVVTIFFGIIHGRTVRTGMNDLSYAHKAAGLWLKENTPTDAAIMSRDLAVSLYAERGFVASPRADYGDYLAYARRKGADYLLVDERELLVLRPHLSFLLDDAHPPVELEPVFKSRDGKGLTIVYRIKD